MYSNNHRGYDIEGGASASSSHRGRAAGGGRSANPHGGDTNANILEQQNNERISMLSDQVARLKGLTIDIGNEVREQNSLLDNMGDGFQSTRDMLTGSLRRISTMLESGGMKHMCYMVGFCVLVMIFLWWLMSYKGTSGA
jgi:blocked-early-in-transport protein 1